MTIRDPVCGKKLDLAKAMASEDHDGWAYFFCSARCHGLFRRSPGSYATETRRLPDRLDPGATAQPRSHQ